MSLCASGEMTVRPGWTEGRELWTSEWPVLAPNRSWPEREKKRVGVDSVSESM